MNGELRLNPVDKKVREEVIIFFSVLKWIVLATIIGMIVGSAASIFLILLNYGIESAGHISGYYYFLPFFMMLSVLIVKYFAPEASGHGTEKVIDAIHRKSGRMNPLVVPVKLAATIITLSFGGSAGKEGPCAQIGAGLSSLFADIFKFDDTDRKKLVICGISAGFGAVFGTPISGAIFGVEVLVVGSILYDVLLPSFIAGITSFQIASFFGIEYSYHKLYFISLKFSELLYLKVILAGLFFGLCSLLLIESLHLFERAALSIKAHDAVKALSGGAALVLFAEIFSSDYLGLGLNTLEKAINGEEIVCYAFLLKILFTSITLGFGGSGGIVTPIFFIGAAAGSAYAGFMGLDRAMFSAIGFVSLLAGAANTPIAASIMAVEVFGSRVAPYAAVACVISFVITGHRSVYPSQILAVKKSSSLTVALGGQVESTDTGVNIKKSKFVRLIYFLFGSSEKEDEVSKK